MNQIHRISATIRDGQEVTVDFIMQRAEPEVGFMSDYAEPLSVVDDATGKDMSLELTDAEYQELAHKLSEDAYAAHEDYYPDFE
jgi:hypothetical protein